MDKNGEEIGQVSNENTADLMNGFILVQFYLTVSHINAQNHLLNKNVSTSCDFPKEER